MGQTAEIEWCNGGVPVSTRFDDPYFSLDNGLAETEHVFLEGNGVPGRFRDGFHIAELGFGTGLNLLAALRLWRASGQNGRLHFTTFEAFPMVPPDMIAAQDRFPELADLSTELAPLWPAMAREFESRPTLTASAPENAPFSEPFFASKNGPADLCFTFVRGDARDTLAHWTGQADAWFLDGFSPAKNPELWQPDLMAQVASHTAPGGTAATYTAAGFVRRGLEQGGFDVARRAGYGRKRHMTTARMPAQ